MDKILISFLAICMLGACKKESTPKEGLLKGKVELAANAPQEVVDEKKTIQFPSRDGLPITADVYLVGGRSISVLLCHQAGFSRGEYKDTALELNKLGYSVMAIDQRSGKIANDVVNETAKEAKIKNLSTTYLDARQDIEAAIDHIYSNNDKQPLLLVGSSYSASLALIIGNNNDKIERVAAFSPGEYFKGVNIQDEIKDYDKPVFVTASKSETPALATLVSDINPKVLTHYKPMAKGIHGSRVLWETTEGTKGYWEAFKDFLK